MRIVLLVFLTTHCLSSIAQDLLIKNDGDTIKAVVIFVYPNEIKFKKYDDLSGTTFTISKRELIGINYNNGGMEFFTHKEPENKDAFSVTPKSAMGSAEVMYSIGVRDAYKYYKGYKPASTTTFISSAVFFPLGLTIAGFAGASEPTDDLGFPDTTLKANPDYSKGYIVTAKKRKSSRVWANFWLGTLTSFALYGIISTVAVTR